MSKTRSCTLSCLLPDRCTSGVKDADLGLAGYVLFREDRMGRRGVIIHQRNYINCLEDRT